MVVSFLPNSTGCLVTSLAKSKSCPFRDTNKPVSTLVFFAVPAVGALLSLDLLSLLAFFSFIYSDVFSLLIGVSVAQRNTLVDTHTTGVISTGKLVVSDGISVA